MEDNKNTYSVTIETDGEMDARFICSSYSDALDRLAYLYSIAKTTGIVYESTVDVPLVKLIKNIHLDNGERVRITIQLINN